LYFRNIKMISEHIKRNTYYTFVFNLSDAQSIFNAIRQLQIDPRCAKMLASLPPGQCIFRQASYGSAMWCEIDFVQPARNIGIVKYDTHNFIPPIDSEQTKKIIEKLYKSASNYKADTSAEKNKQSELETISLKLLSLWAETPYTPAARLFERLGNFHYTMQIEIRKFIEQNGWAKFEEARVGRTTMLLMQITKEGYNTLQIPMPKGNTGRGGIIHRHYAMWIKSHFEKKGNKAYLEWIVPGTNHPVDVAIEFENHHEAYEISVSATDNLVSHIDIFEKNKNIKKLTIVTGTKTELAKIKKLIKSNLLLARFEDRIKLDVIENYMERNTK